MDLGSHIFDLLDHLHGPILAAKGSAVRACDASPGGTDIEDVVVGTWCHKSPPNRPILGSCTFNFASSENIDEVKITGTQGTITFVVFNDDLPVFVSAATGESELIPFDSFGGVQEHVHGPLVDTVVRDLLDGTSSCPSTGESALRTQKVLDSLLNDRMSYNADYL